MTELPPEIVKNFGLTNRQFRKNAAPTRDQAGWTDTPADKERKEKVLREPSYSDLFRLKPSSGTLELLLRVAMDSYTKMIFFSMKS